MLGNFIGTDSSSTVALGNNFEGIWLAYGAQDNVVGPGNAIANHSRAGVAVEMDSSIHNTSTQNSITANHDAGILLYEGGNQGLSAPTITSFSESAVTGTAPPNSTVEIFSDPDDEGKIYEGSATADGAGNFQWHGTPAGPNVTATTTDADGNTSAFSQPLLITGIDLYSVMTKPTRFVLDQNYPNPFNPVTNIRYQLPKISSVKLTVYNILGEVVATLVNEKQPPGTYLVKWDGKNYKGNRVSRGIYVYELTASDFIYSRKLLRLR